MSPDLDGRGGVDSSPKSLIGMVLRRWAGAALVLGFLLFLPAGTFDYWEAWVYMAILLLPALVVILVGVRTDPALIERRMRLREKEPEQQRIVKYSSILFPLAFVIPGLDHRFGWSAVPTEVVIASDALVLLGYLLFVRVLKENSYASRIVEVEQSQRVISTGPYGLVRHPMYVAVLLIYTISPLALASFWGLAISLWFVPVMVARIRNEESVLAKDLPGYIEYMRRTPYRLIPGVW